MPKTKEHNESDRNTILNIINNYSQNEKALVNQLHFKAEHGTTIGGFREEIWKEMFQQIIPKKFVIEQSVFILDSHGRVSNEVDLAIFDETYTPYIFRYGKLKFLPIEAVAVAVECKSKTLSQVKLKDWAERMAVLTTSRKSYTRLANGILVGETASSSTQTQTRPLRILCCLKEGVINKSLKNGSKMFDIIVRAPLSNEGLQIEIDEGKKDLKDWYFALNHAGDAQTEKQGDASNQAGLALEGIRISEYQVSQKAGVVSLLTLNLQLNQLLMLINNPMPFPHKAYAKMFNRVGEEHKSNG